MTLKSAKQILDDFYLCQNQPEKQKSLFYQLIHKLQIESAQDQKLTVFHLIFGSYRHLEVALEKLAQLEHPDWAHQQIKNLSVQYRELIFPQTTPALQLLHKMRTDLPDDEAEYLGWILLQGPEEYPDILAKIPLALFYQQKKGFWSHPEGLPTFGALMVKMANSGQNLPTENGNQVCHSLRVLLAASRNLRFPFPPNFFSSLFSLNELGQSRLSEIIVGEETSNIDFEFSDESNFSQIFSTQLKALFLFRQSFLKQELPLYEELFESQHKDELVFPKITDNSINIIGYALNDLGIGEDCRALYHALNDGKNNVRLIALKPAGRNFDAFPQLNKHLSQELKGKINIFCMPLVDFMTQKLKFGNRILDGHYNICFAPWEFDEWPKDYDFCVKGLQEIWGISNFVTKAYERFDIKVLSMPNIVLKGETAQLSRTDFGLDPSAFTFMFCFDFNSSIKRKNPFGVIKAFQLAFPQNETHVQLVIKTMGGPGYDKQRKHLYQLAEQDPRIHLIHDQLERAAFNSLISLSDCFVSLHRCEGFGRALAEAMLFDKPVIATDYSGSSEFLNSQTGFPVSYQLTAVLPEEYPMAEGLFWAEPNLDCAARQMREVRQNSERARDIAQQGHRFITQNHGADTARKKLQNRINAIFQEMVIK